MFLSSGISQHGTEINSCNILNVDTNSNYNTRNKQVTKSRDRKDQTKQKLNYIGKSPSVEQQNEIIVNKKRSVTIIGDSIVKSVHGYKLKT